MQMEWSKWLMGMTSFKEAQGMLWIFVLVLFVVMHKASNEEKQKLFAFSKLTAALVLFPLTAMILLKVYTPFYDWLDLQGIVPWVFLLSLGAVKFFEVFRTNQIPGLHFKEKTHTIIGLLCVMVLLLAGTGFRAFTTRQQSVGNGLPIKAAEVFWALEEYLPERKLVVAAPAELISYVRFFEEDWQPLYGRDLWSPKAASYINSGYTMEYEYYELLGKQELTMEEAMKLAELVRTGPADCVMVPSSWIYLLEEESGLVILELSDAYAGIIKKDLITE